jgi:ribosomal protein S18 acetylase RimI-like enzyme
MTANVVLRRGGGDLTLSELDDITNLYLAIRAEPPYNSAPLYTREAFLTRTTKQAGSDGFEIVIAQSPADGLVGFAFGLPFAEDVWWTGPGTTPPSDLLTARKFAVIELNVRPDYRHHGLGTKLLTELLDGRDEPYAILTTRGDTAARRLYERLGWEQTGTVRHMPGGTVFDQLALKLANR